MEIALGPAIQNIITEDQECAKALIEYLRSRNGGRATFQPLDTVTGRAPFAGAQKVKAMPGVLGFANELVQYHEQYGAILSRLLGYVVVAEDFDTAAAISKEYGNVLRVVTLKGDIFNIGGSITGGSTGNRAGNILSRKGELDTLCLLYTSSIQEFHQVSDALDALGNQLGLQIKLQHEDIFQSMHRI